MRGSRGANRGASVTAHHRMWSEWAKRSSPRRARAFPRNHSDRVRPRTTKCAVVGNTEHLPRSNFNTSTVTRITRR